MHEKAIEAAALAIRPLRFNKHVQEGRIVRAAIAAFLRECEPSSAEAAFAAVHEQDPWDDEDVKRAFRAMASALADELG